MAARLSHCLLSLCALVHVSRGVALDTTTTLLKQAADTLLLQPSGLGGGAALPVAAAGPSYKVALPGPTDLSMRRLQVNLSAQVEDNWKDLRDPQRWVIYQSSGVPALKIAASFAPVVEAAKAIETAINVPIVEYQLNNLDLQPTEDLQMWIQYWDRVRKYVGQIEQMYGYFHGFVTKPESAKVEDLEDYATFVAMPVDTDSSLIHMLDEFHAVISNASTDHKQLFPFLQELFTKNEAHLCSLTQSPNQLLYNLYNIVALTEIKGYAMVQFAYMILKINGKGNFTTEAEAAKKSFETDAMEKLNNVKEILPNLSREFLRCDPLEHIEDKTFLQVKQLMQGYIENEVDMNDRGSCKSSCQAYTYAQPKGCYNEQFCAKQPQCKGRIFDCQFYNADAWVCMSQNPDRRYDWIEYEDGTILGPKDQCINKIKVDSWWRYLVWHCSYCFCKCEERTPTSEIYWSLLPALSSSRDNRIVTGLRFVKRNRVFSIQIEEAEALPEGGVNEETKKWIEPTPIPENDLHNSSAVFAMSYEQRALDLDNVVAPEGHVLTGVKLRNIGGHINLEIQATPISFTEGRLVSDRSSWLANDNTPASERPRQLMPIILPDVPTRLIGQNKIDSVPDQYLQFDTTSSHKDASQTIVPFMDAQEVSPKPSTWLAGAGLYHRGRVGYGGFVGISVATYDFSRYMLPNK